MAGCEESVFAPYACAGTPLGRTRRTWLETLASPSTRGFCALLARSSPPFACADAHARGPPHRLRSRH
eukprot:scaffold160651_cov28-Tisochrysis_lutea.AAC.1